MELARSTSRGGFSVRGILLCVLTVLLTALLGTLFLHAPVSAADPPTATWQGDSISYEGNQYLPNGEAKEGESHGLTVGSHYYIYTEMISERPLVQKAHLIIFSPGRDPPTTPDATYVVYDFDAPNNAYSNPTQPVQLKVEPDAKAQTGTSCAIEFGIGWAVCGISMFMASGMDWIFDVILRQFIEVQPPQTGRTDNDLYTAWNIVRSVANIAFIIAFIVIIYSQLTSLGLSNYGLKKLIPRLIVAAILVNMSYYICSIAIDASNILGYAVQDIFTALRENLFQIDGDTWRADDLSWENLMAFVLSGGTIAGLGIAGVAAFLGAAHGSITSAFFLLLPAILGLLITIMIVFIILAARQALIILLLIVAPLAFVANLLPNTEKLFIKWRDLFVKMLVFFPAFSLVFGGSQLAGGIIIQNAANLMVVILGMIVQLAPLAISPLLLRLSGDLIGKIASIAKDVGKKAVDPTRDWAKRRAEYHGQRAIGGPLKRRNIARRAARSWAYRQHRLERGTEAGKAGFEEYATQRDITSKKGQKMEVDIALAKLETETLQADFKKAIEELRGGSEQGLEQLREQDLKLRENQQERYENLGRPAVERFVQLNERARVIAQATHLAQEIQQENFARALAASRELQVRAGGIDHEHGADSALASAIHTIREAYNKNVEEARAINKQFNLSSIERQEHAMGRREFSKTTTIAGQTVERHFTIHDTFTREAAIEDQTTFGTANEVEEIVSNSGEGGSVHQFATTIADALAKAPGQQAKLFHLSGQSIDDISQGRVNGASGLNWLATRSIARGKLSENELTSLDPVSVARYLEVMRTGEGLDLLNANEQANFWNNVRTLSATAREAFTGDHKSDIKDGARADLIRIGRLTDPGFNDPEGKLNVP